MTKEDFKSFVETFKKVYELRQMTSYKGKEFSLADDGNGIYIFRLIRGKMVVQHIGNHMHTPGTLIDKISVWFAAYESGVTKMCVNFKCHDTIIFSTSLTDDYGQADYDLMKAVADRYNAEDEEEEGGEA